MKSKAIISIVGTVIVAAGLFSGVGMAQNIGRQPADRTRPADRAILSKGPTCQCDLTTLMGTQATIHYASFPSNTNWTGPVTSGIEVPSSPGTTPSWQNPQRFNINVQASKIRVEFARDASYGFGAQFLFTLAPHAPAPCGAATIVGSSVKTNRSDAKPHVTTPVFTASTVTIVFDNVTSPAGGPRAFPDWKKGDWIETQLKFACGDGTQPPDPDPVPVVLDPCCPPWNSTQLSSMLFYQGTGPISAPYTLNFQPTAALHAQLNAYVAYLASLTLAPPVTGLTIAFSAFDAGTGSTANSSGPSVGSGSMTWTGGPPAPTANFFGSGVMQVGHWYRIQTTVTLNGGPRGWLQRKCIRSYVDVRIQVIGSRMAPGAGAGSGGPSVLQMRLENGSVLERPVEGRGTR